MYKVISNIRIIIAGFAVIYSISAYSYESSLVADIDVRNEYNDNIFVTNLPHESVTAIIVAPSLHGIIKDRHWETKLDAKLRSNNYSDSTLDSDDKFFSVTGLYNAERNIYSLNLDYDLDSNLSTESTDFGISGRRVNRERKIITPQYTRLLNERATLVLAYTNADVDYHDAEDLAFTPYTSHTGTASFFYNLTEIDRLSLVGQAVDYSSKDGLTEYQLFLSQIGLDHEFSETLSTDFLVGVSNRTSSNLNIEQFEFFGTIITRRLETDFTDRGFVLNAGIKKKFEKGALEGRISRDNTTNSYGGLNQVDRLKVSFNDEITSLWKYYISSYFEDTTALSSGSVDADREALFFESTMHYSIARNFKLSASYRTVRRKFKSDTSDSKAPRSNSVYIGITYNFPSLSTF